MTRRRPLQKGRARREVELARLALYGRTPKVRSNAVAELRRLEQHPTVDRSHRHVGSGTTLAERVKRERGEARRFGAGDD